MKVHSLRLSLFQLELLKDTVVGFGENQKMIHLPTESGERVPVPLPIEVLDSLISNIERLGDEGPQTIKCSLGEILDGVQKVELKWGEEENGGNLHYEIRIEDYQVE